jgi:hypothetical protein
MECFDGGSPKHNQLGGLLPFFKCAKNTVRYRSVLGRWDIGTTCFCAFSDNIDPNSRALRRQSEAGSLLHW